MPGYDVARARTLAQVPAQRLDARFDHMGEDPCQGERDEIGQERQQEALPSRATSAGAARGTVASGAMPGPGLR